MEPVSSSMIVPALPSLSQDLKIDTEIESQLLISLFVFGWGLGPLFLAPLSEIFGRMTLLNLGHALFLVVNTLCIFTRIKFQFILLQFVASVVESAPLAVSFPTSFYFSPSTQELTMCSNKVGSWCIE